MKKLLLPLLLFTSIITKAQSPEMCKIMEAEAATAKYKPTQLKSAPQTEKYDVNFYSINVALDPSDRRIEGSVTTYFTVNDSALSGVYDKLHND